MPTTLITRPIRSGPAARARIAWPTGMMRPPPRPCTTRNTTSEPSDHERPARTEPAMKSTRAAIHTRFAPNRRVSQPLSGITAANASR